MNLRKNPVNVTNTNRGDDFLWPIQCNSEANDSDPTKPNYLTTSASALIRLAKILTTSPFLVNTMVRKPSWPQRSLPLLRDFLLPSNHECILQKFRDNSRTQGSPWKPELKPTYQTPMSLIRPAMMLWLLASKDHLFKVTSLKHNKITGTNNGTRRRLSALHHSYDKHWRITDNGQPVQGISVLNDNLLAIPLRRATTILLPSSLLPNAKYGIGLGQPLGMAACLVWYFQPIRFYLILGKVHLKSHLSFFISLRCFSPPYNGPGTRASISSACTSVIQEVLFGSFTTLP